MAVAVMNKQFDVPQRQILAQMLADFRPSSQDIDPKWTQHGDEIPRFYMLNDNEFTYNFTGLIEHLLKLGQGRVWSSQYVREKVDILERLAKEQDEADNSV